MLMRPLRLDVIAYFKPPKRVNNTMRQLMLRNKIAVLGIDWDNLGKLYSDAINEKVYPDDKRITTGYVDKRWSEIPRVEITVTERDMYFQNDDFDKEALLKSLIQQEQEEEGFKQLSFI